MQAVQEAARVIEVFPSLQGEGLYVGRPHLFVRFWNCNLACRYCDTDYHGPYGEYTPQRLTGEVRRLLETKGPFHAVSLTGGEPLLWAGFLHGWLPWLREMGQMVYLETNGTLPSELEEVLPWTDIVAMDVKPPSATGDRETWGRHERFLRVCAEAGKEVFVKVVVTRETLDEEVRRSAKLVAAVDPEVPFILQPVTPWGPVREGPLPEQLARWSRLAGTALRIVRVVPQVHRMLGIP